MSPRFLLCARWIFFVLFLVSSVLFLTLDLHDRPVMAVYYAWISLVNLQGGLAVMLLEIIQQRSR